VKRDYLDKIDHINRDFFPMNPQKVFYPIDKHGKIRVISKLDYIGVVDEWDALIKQ
jgi:hypothetical protein